MVDALTIAKPLSNGSIQLDIQDLFKKPKSTIPDQYEKLLAYVGKLCRENEDLIDLPGNPPLCEQSLKPILLESFEDPEATYSSQGKPFKDYQGNVATNCNQCPYCDVLCYTTAAIGQLVHCLSCGGTFRFSAE